MDQDIPEAFGRDLDNQCRPEIITFHGTHSVHMKLEKTKLFSLSDHEQQTKMHVNVLLCLEMRVLGLRQIPS